MSCEKWEERIAEQIGGEFSKEVEAHLRACPDCVRLAEELENDRLSLAAAPRDAADADFAAMRRQIRSAILRERRLRRYVPALVAAAAALVAIALIHPGPRPVVKLPSPVIPSARMQTNTPAVSARPVPVTRRLHIRRAVTRPIDMALLRRVTGQQPAPDTGSESPVEMQIATANPDVTIILVQAKEGSYE
jgi:anti-sigma factor RsiW